MKEKNGGKCPNTPKTVWENIVRHLYITYIMINE